MIEFTSVNFDYPNGVRALSDVSFFVPEKDFLFLSGPTGAGKSTILKLIHLQLKPTGGTVRISETHSNHFSPKEAAKLRRKIGFIFQDGKLLEERTVFENVAYPLVVAGATSREIQRKVPKVLNLVSLTHKAYKRANHLSSGERQRTCIARAIITAPDIILADEPTGHVDRQTGWEMMQILQKLHREGTTVIVASHDPLWAERLGKRVISLYGGKIVDTLPNALLSQA